jgi:xylulokinase
VVADLTQRPVAVPRHEELVACGAALQAAALLHGRGFEEVAVAWDLQAGEVIEPDPRVDAADIRGVYRELTQKL